MKVAANVTTLRRSATLIVRLILPVLVFLLLYGCATPMPQVESLPPQAEIFFSDDYIVYKRRQHDTPESLARQFFGDEGKSWIIEETNTKMPFQANEWIIIPRRVRNKGGIYENGFQQIPILCYHRFGDECESPLCVPARIFDRQMNYLKTNGFRVITPEDILAFLEYRAPLPKKSVMITVDDGYRSVYDVAYPILKKYGFTATIFIYTNFVGVSSKAITWDQLREMKTNGFTIGSHTIAHSDLSKQGDDEDEAAYLRRLRHEIKQSKDLIDSKLDQDTMFFAYPFGRANGTAVMICHEAGYRLAVTVNRGGNAVFANPFMLRRDQILKRDMATFTKRLKTFHSIPLR